MNISFENAQIIAGRHVSLLQENFDLKIQLLEGALEDKKGWVFLYNSLDFIRSGNPLDSLAGNAPFLVTRDTGSIIVLGTDKPISDYLQTI